MPTRYPALLALAAILTACSKEPVPVARPQPITPAPNPIAPAPAPPTPEKIDEALRERLARQEAATRLFAAPERPAASAASAKPAAPSPKVEPPKAEPPKAAPAPARTSPATPPPAAAQTAAKAPPPTPAPAPTPVSTPAPAPPPTPAPRTDLAVARPPPAPAPAPESGALKLVTRIDPEFPREAVQAGVDQGRVRARMTLDGAGSVTRVEILDASPRRVFDRAVIRALSQWRYSEGAAGRTVEMEVAFRR